MAASSTRGNHKSTSIHTLALVSTTLGTSTMNTVFYFYYVKIFLHMYHVSESWFYICQTVFLIWNAINDPLFGYFQEMCNIDCCRVRRLTILYGSIWYSILFLVPWFPWASSRSENHDWITGMHLLVSLCLFDTLYTYVLLAWCSLFTEMSDNFSERLHTLRYCQTAWLVSKFGVMICEYFSSNLQNFYAFQNVCIGISVFGFVCMVFTGLYGKSHKERVSSSVKSNEVRNIWSLWQLLKQKDFLCFVVTNLLQTIHITCDESFFRIYSERLIFKNIPEEAFVKTVFYGSLPIVPTIIAILIAPILKKYGVYYLIMASFLVKSICGIFMYCIGKDHSLFTAAYFLLDMCLVACPWSWFSLTLSDLIDEDRRVHQRATPISSMAYGMNALVTKPGHSIAPMLIIGYLSNYGYEHMNMLAGFGEVKTNKIISPTADETELLSDAMFNIACGVPVVIGMLQFVIFFSYSLTATHYKEKENGVFINEFMI